MVWRVIEGQVVDGLRSLEAGSVHCVVTSPPYWGLRDYGVDGQIGLEPTVEAFVDRMVEVFAEVWRVLRDDGTVWLNIGDSYASDGKDRSVSQATARTGLTGGLKSQCAGLRQVSKARSGLAKKNLCLVPFRLALALQAWGWTVRSRVVWAKPNPMPESVMDRPTQSFEDVFLLTKGPKYFYDQAAVREDAVCGNHLRTVFDNGPKVTPPGTSPHSGIRKSAGIEAGRNMRNVWSIATYPYSEAHFATFPPELARRCIVAGSSEHGCCEKCGKPWERVTKTSYENPGNRSTNGPRSTERKHKEYGSAGFSKRLEKSIETTGWKAKCKCEAGIVPCTVLDPFTGSGTTLMVAEREGRDSVGIELNPEYARLARRRIEGDCPLFNRMEA